MVGHWQILTALSHKTSCQKIKTDNMKMAVSIVQYAPPLYTDIVCGTLRISQRAESHTLVNTQFGVTAWPKIHVLEQCESESARPLEEGWHPWREKRYKHRKKEKHHVTAVATWIWNRCHARADIFVNVRSHYKPARSSNYVSKHKVLTLHISSVGRKMSDHGWAGFLKYICTFMFCVF